mgnify:CR=1 FL=1
MRILIADDEQFARQRLRDMLQTIEGAEVVGEAETGREAFDRAAEDFWNLEGDGIEVKLELADDLPHRVLIGWNFRQVVTQIQVDNQSLLTKLVCRVCNSILDQLDLHSRRTASWLRERFSPGDRALLLYSPGIEFTTAFSLAENAMNP